ncbi:predicted protein [Culex quinquefasciatus]|uniref:Predicted protein n=1 Tax=Culex quinquefasciatus TaxID=7176 RepID=B0XH32_CULQU|nr:predicted protein [Culex quinquefasciatus]|eukprot:XP_001868954.1 predicted protein [Culex quinquefasciatus]
MDKINVKDKYFEFDEATHTYKCKVKNCTSALKCKNTLRRHIAEIHGEIAREAGIIGYKRKEKLYHGDAPNPKKLKSITIEVDPDLFQQGLVEMAAVNSISLNFFDSKAYKNTAGLVADVLGLPIHADAMASFLSTMAKTVRELIAEELKGNLFSLKFDGATRGGRKILGVNAQLIVNSKIRIRTLSMLEMVEKQTGLNLKTHIDGVLESYGSTIQKVYAVNTDRGKNMLNCSSRMKQDQEQALQAESCSNAQSDLLDGTSDNCDETCCEEEDSADSMMDLELDEILEEVDTIFQHGQDSFLESVCCGAHTLNLIFKDTMDDETSNWLDKVRSIVKAAKRTEFRGLFKLGKIPLPKIDVVTRWGSTFEMIDSVSSYKDFYVEIGEQCAPLKLEKEDWSIMEHFVSAYKFLHAATKSFQKPDLLMGDMLCILKRLKFNLTQLPSDNRFVTGLLATLKKRTQSLYESNAFKAALLFDHRWSFFKSPFFKDKADKAKAIDHMLRVAKSLKQSKERQDVQSGVTAEPSPTTSTSDPSIADDGFEAMLRQECAVAAVSTEEGNVDFKGRLLKLLNYPKRLASGTDILKFWEAQKEADPEMYELAMIALSVPVTQVSVERCFSAVKLLLEQHRLQMSAERLDDLMILRCNRDLIPLAIELLKKRK